MTDFRKIESRESNRESINQNYWAALIFVCTCTLNTRLSKLNFHMYKKKFIINK